MRIVGAGAGGHAQVILDILLAAGHEVVALTDPRPELHGSHILGVPVAGDDSLLAGFRREGVEHAFVGLGGADDTGPRRRLTEHVESLGFSFLTVVHPSAVVSAHAEVGAGSTILANAVVNASARLGEHVLVNTGAIVEHDCAIGRFAHVATGARLASGVEVGEGAHVGAGATVRQSIRIGANALVGIGAAVAADVPEGAVVAGVPARPLQR